MVNVDEDVGVSTWRFSRVNGARVFRERRWEDEWACGGAE
jgi:hypothetical protein